MLKMNGRTAVTQGWERNEHWGFSIHLWTFTFPTLEILLPHCWHLQQALGGNHRLITEFFWFCLCLDLCKPDWNKPPGHPTLQDIWGLNPAEFWSWDKVCPAKVFPDLNSLSSRCSQAAWPGELQNLLLGTRALFPHIPGIICVQSCAGNGPQEVSLALK